MKKRYLVIIVSVIVILAIAATAFFINRHDKKTGNIAATVLYFINDSRTSINQADANVYYSDADNLVHQITAELSLAKYNHTVPFGTQVNYLSRNDDGTMHIDLSHNFLTSDVDYNTLRTYAYIKSICSAGNIIDATGVKVTVDDNEIISPNGEYIDYLYAGSVNLSSDMADLSDDVVALYHLTGSGKLKRQTYTAAVSGMLSTEEFILSRLGTDPGTEGLKKSYTNAADIIGVTTSDGICYVNLKESFVSANSGANKEKAVIFSMVNSLVALDDVEGVVILVDGKYTDKFGSVDISGILTENYGIVE